MAKTEHLTLTAATVGVLPMTTGVADERVTRVSVEVAGSGTAFVTVDGTVPTVAGDNTYAIDAGDPPREFEVPTPAATVNVRAISAGTPRVSAEIVGVSSGN